MKKLLIVGLAAATAACGTVQRGYDPRQDVDIGKVAAVERAAQQFNLDVIWINPPMKDQRAR